MEYQTPEYSRTKVDKSARVLIDSDSDDKSVAKANTVVSNWRSAHAFPLNTITIDLKKKSRRVDRDALVVQRVKRNRSLLAKLSREESMRLTQMQDIGGCRAVFDSIEDVEKIRALYSKSRAEHKFIESYDYIESPKPSGYRGVHLVYSYRSKTKPQYNGLLCEVQLRTAKQHAWATAVETVGAVLGQSLKSSEGEARWLDFFRYAAAAFAHMERSPIVPGIGENKYRISRRLTTYMDSLAVEETLDKYRYALRATEGTQVRNAGYFLLVLRPEAPTLEIFAFRKGQYEAAYQEYLGYEKELPNFSPDPQLPLFPELSDYSGAQAVLVGAESFRSLRQSYPNYFLDTEMFIDAIQSYINR